MTTPAQQIEGLEQAIRELDQQIDQREAELVDQQSALHDGKLDDPERRAIRDGEAVPGGPRPPQRPPEVALSIRKRLWQPRTPRSYLPASET